MVYITQLIYLLDGQRSVFEQFEAVAIPIIADHGGELLLRQRCSSDGFVEGSWEAPDEIHVITFPDEAAFQTFMRDPRRQDILHLKEASIQTAILFKGQKL